MTKFDVLGFGALNVDMLFKVDKFATAEKESFIEDYTEACGGSAANTIVGLAQAWLQSRFHRKSSQRPRRQNAARLLQSRRRGYRRNR